jgi:hypothetical protein
VGSIGPIVSPGKARTNSSRRIQCGQGPSDAGIGTIARLEARGFIEATSDGFGRGDHRITPVGEAEWLRLYSSASA